MLQLLKSSKIEAILFLIAVSIHLFPILSLSPFVTLDGPAHLYNSKLIREMFFNNGNVAHHFFRFNGYPEPNWSGHFMMCILGSIFTPIYTEKIFLSTIVILLAYGFRYLTNALAPSQRWLSWLVFPWIFNFPFLLGFFNYTIAICLWFFVLGFWIKNEHALNKRRIALLILLLIVVYFSHLIMVGIALLSMAIWSYFSADKSNLKTRIKLLIYVSIPFIVLFCLFIFEKGVTGYRADNARLSWKVLFEHYTQTQSLIIYNGDLEGIYGNVYAIGIVVALIFSFAFRSIGKFLVPSIILTVVLIALHWIIPDSLASGGIMSIRIAQLIFLSFLFIIICLMPSQKVQLSLAIFSLMFSLMFLRVHYKTQVVLSHDAAEYFKLSKIINPNSIILPLNYSDNWMHSNLSNYLGANYGMLTLDNYEANAGHFPLIWKDKMNPEIYIGNFPASNKPCVDLLSKIPDLYRAIDYIVILNQPINPTDSCSINVKNQLNNAFLKVPFESNLLTVYKPIN